MRVTPSTACGNSFRHDFGGKLLPPPARTPSTACGRSPSLEEGGLWGGVRGTSKYRRERAKGDRGDRKAPICNRRQGRRAWPTGEPGGVEKGNFSTGDGRGTPSTACGRSPSLGEGGLWGEGTSKLLREGAKGLRGDRKAPIYNRPQNRRFCWARNPMGNDCIACGLCGHALR